MPPRTDTDSRRLARHSLRERGAAPRRRAFTLTEILLVLVVLVAAAAAVFPDMRAWQSRWTLREAARSFQTVLQSARTRAIESGETQVVSFEPGGSRYSIRTDLEIPSPSRRTARRGDGLSGNTGSECEGTLPASCRFAGDSQEPGTSRPNVVRFRPDGTADAARLLLSSESGDVLVLLVDRLTGACQIVAE